jgi:hypothetical protein
MLVFSNLYTQEKELWAKKRILSSLQIIVFTSITGKVSHFNCCRSGVSIAQAVSRWLPTAAARVRARVWSSGICGGQNGAGADFL